MANALPKIQGNDMDYTTKVIRFPQKNIEVDEPAETTKPTHARKPAGVSSEVFAFSFEDAKKVLDYFRDHEKWIHYLLFTITCNMARRIGDTLKFKWVNFYNPKTGNIRENIFIQEEKTDKFSNPRINQAVKDAIALYIEKTGCDPSTDDYQKPVFYQLSGTHKGTLLSYSGCIKALKKAAAEVGIEYNVGMHSTRKTFGAMTMALHPGDYDSKSVLQGIYRHSSEQMTQRYIGLTKKREDEYFDDYGKAFDDYIVGDKVFNDVAAKPVVSLDVNDLRAIISMAYEAGMKNAECSDVTVHINAQNEIMGIVDSLVK